MPISSPTTANHDGTDAAYPPPPGQATVVPAAVADWFAVPPAEPSAEALRSAGFLLRREIGRGAMGIVFEAEQLDLRRTVAVKILHPACPLGPQPLARFRAEAEAAARLSHPNIVAVHGLVEVQGKTLLVMECVAGESLAARLGRGPLKPTEAAGLVAAVADAIAHSHERGVVHRDLKPANILLVSAGVVSGESSKATPLTTHHSLLTPKVTDFGLAKLLDADAGQTQTGTVLGTPAYMAPEQAAAGSSAAGPAADLYALGVILYECLTGRPPFRAASAAETLDLVRSADPVAPRRLAAVPRDLETIALKCLEKDPFRRYKSAGDLAADLRRFLDGRPVLARPAGPVTRVRKWSRRRPAAAALVGFSVFGVLAAAAGLTAHTERLRREADRANRGEAAAVAERERAVANYRDARAALQRMLDRVRNGRRDIPAVKDLQRQHAEDALAFFWAVADRADGRPEVRADAARAGLEAARLQVRLGRRDEAIANLRRVCDQFAALAAESPDAADYRAGWAAALNDLGAQLGSAGRLDDELRLHTQAAELMDAIVAAEPNSAEYRDAFAGSHHSIGNVHWWARRFTDAARHQRLAIGLRERLVAENPHDRRYARRLAETELSLSIVLQTESVHPDAAIEFHDRAERRFERLLADDPADADVLADLAQLTVNWAYVLQSRGETDRPLADLAKTAGLLEAALKREPADTVVLTSLYRTYGARAQILYGAKQFAESAAAWEQVVSTATPEQKNLNRLFLAEALAHAGDHERALVTAEAAAAALAEKPAWNQPYHIVRVCGLILTSTRTDPATTDRVARLADRMMHLVKALVTPAEWRDLRPGLLADPRFAPLLSRPDFRQLVER